MVAFFILLVMAIAIIATFGYTVFSFQQTAEISSNTQRNASRMEIIASIIRGNMIQINVGGPMRVLAGDTVSGRNGLPRAIVGDDHTPWGATYGYCPMSLKDPSDNASAQTITIAGGINYNVKVKTVDNKQYVVESPDATITPPPAPNPKRIGTGGLPNNLVGFILSPSPLKFAIPRCDQIIYSKGTYLIGRDANNDGTAEFATVPGTVFPIFAPTPREALLAPDLDPTIFVATDGTTTATGASELDPMTLVSAIDYWRTARPPELTIVMEPGTYSLPPAKMKFEQADLIGRPSTSRHLRLTDTTPGAYSGATITSTTAADLDFRTDATLEGITLGSGIGVRVSPGANVRIESSYIGQLRVDGGNAVVGSNSVIYQHTSRVSPAFYTAMNSPLSVWSGKLTIAQRGSTTLLVYAAQITPAVPGILSSGGQVNIQANVDFVDSKLPWYISGSGDLNLGDNAQISWNDTDPVPVGATPAIRATRVTKPKAGTATAAESCSNIQPYVVQATCSITPTTSGALISSKLTPVAAGVYGAEGWECKWGAPASLGPPYTVPASGTNITLDCSASPP